MSLYLPVMLLADLSSAVDIADLLMDQVSGMLHGTPPDVRL